MYVRMMMTSVDEYDDNECNECCNADDEEEEEAMLNVLGLRS